MAEPLPSMRGALGLVPSLREQTVGRGREEGVGGEGKNLNLIPNVKTHVCHPR